METIRDCAGNPINYVDPSGHIPLGLYELSKNLAEKAAKTAIAAAKKIHAKTKLATSVAGSKFLKGKKLDIANDLFQHGIWGNGKLISSSLRNRMKKKIENSTEFKTTVKKNIKKESKGNTVYSFGGVEFKKNVSSDLYYGIQKAGIYFSGKKRGNNWDLNVSMWDTYDFGEWRLLKGGLNFANAANDLGTAMEKTGMMTPFFWALDFKYRCKG